MTWEIRVSLAFARPSALSWRFRWLEWNDPTAISFRFFIELHLLPISKLESSLRVSSNHAQRPDRYSVTLSLSLIRLLVLDRFVLWTFDHPTIGRQSRSKGDAFEFRSRGRVNCEAYALAAGFRFFEDTGERSDRNVAWSNSMKRLVSNIWDQDARSTNEYFSRIYRDTKERKSDSRAPCASWLFIVFRRCDDESVREILRVP